MTIAVTGATGQLGSLVVASLLAKVPAGEVVAVVRDAAKAQPLADQGVDETVDVRITCTPYPRDCHSGTSVITVVVATKVQLSLMPDFLGGGAPSFALDSTHTVPIGQFQEIDERP